MCLRVLRLIPIFYLLAYSGVTAAASEDSLGIPASKKITIEVAQECFEIAGRVPEFRYEEVDSFVDTDNIDPCALAIQNNNLTQRDLAASYSNQGLILASKGDFTLAIISHTQAIALLENSEESGFAESIYINRGNSYFAMQDYEAANADYSRAILISAGTQHQALYNRALVFKALGYRQRAFEELAHALLLAPDNPRYLASYELLSIIEPATESAEEELGPGLD